MDEALELKAKGALTEWEEGALFTYFTILDWGKVQAELLDVKFLDRELQALDPYSLLGRQGAGR